MTVQSWRHELGGCLHSTLAHLLAAEGIDPDRALGASWSFRYRDGDVRAEEYYFPAADGASLIEAVAPRAGAVSQWFRPGPGDPAWGDIAAELAEGHLVAVAVDNFYLPFRPAYRDVHANHLLTITALDLHGGVAEILDPVPPAFSGPIGLVDLMAARGSPNPAVHDRDMFFTGRPIDNSWLSLRRVAEPLAWTHASVKESIAGDVAAYRQPSPSGEFWGLAGLEAFLRVAAHRLGDAIAAADELFVVAGTALAASAVHADWLRHAALDFDAPPLSEAARTVDRVAHHWSAIRILAALSRKETSVEYRLERRLDNMMLDYEHALNTLLWAAS